MASCCRRLCVFIGLATQRPVFSFRWPHITDYKRQANHVLKKYCTVGCYQVLRMYRYVRSSNYDPSRLCDHLHNGFMKTRDKSRNRTSSGSGPQAEQLIDGTRFRGSCGQHLVCVCRIGAA